MKLRSEISVGIIVLATLLVSVWGINYLKGKNMLRKTYRLHVSYPQSGGLEESASVFLRGIKIGYVEAIQLDLNKEGVDVCLEIEKKYPLPRGSKALLISADLLGSRAIRMEPGRSAALLSHGDTIIGSEEPGMLAKLETQAGPLMKNVNSLATSLDSLAGILNQLLKEGQTQEILNNMAESTASLKALLEKGGNLDASLKNMETITALVANREGEIDSLMVNLKTISGNLASAKLDSLSLNMQALLEQAGFMMEQVNSGEGSVGAFIYSDTLHTSLTRLIIDLDSLVNDLAENPEDYVQISVFGKSDRKK